MARKPSVNEARIQRDVNLDRDMREMVERLGNIEGSVKRIEARDPIIAGFEYKLADQEKRITELEQAKSAVIKMVLGSVGVAILATVVGQRFI